MKQLGYVCLIMLAAFSFQSCNSGNKDSKETADSLNAVKDTTTDVDATGGIAVVDDDAKFTTKAAAAGMAEVELGKLALSKSTNTQVKDFATMMVSDHGKANEELMTLATAKNISLPTTLDEDHQKMWDELNGKTGTDFDKKYVDDMVEGHKKVLDLLEKQAKDGVDADLKAFAAKTTPVVKAHLDAIKKIKDSMK
jgi:putative membrane protein